MDQWIFSSQCSSENIASLGPNLWVDHFQIFELEQIMRQRDDVKFAEILNRLREGNQDEEDIKTLKGQILQNESNITRILPHLFTRRCDVQQYNKEIFSHINDSNKTIVEAFDSVSGDLLMNSIIKKDMKTIVITNKSRVLKTSPLEDVQRERIQEGHAWACPSCRDS